MDGKIPDFDRRKALAAGIFVLAVAVGLSPMLLDSQTVESRTVSFDANATAVNVSGNDTINLGVASGEKLNFGRIPVEGSSRKYFKINATKKALLYLDAEGNISSQLDFTEKHFFKGSREVDLVFRPESPGFYGGNVSIKIYTPKNEVGAAWLELKSKLY